jgi:hypothetical protein
MKALLICSLSAFLVLAPLHCEAASTAAADRRSLYNYINTQEFAEGAKKFYLETIASNDKRKSAMQIAHHRSALPHKSGFAAAHKREFLR